MQVCPFNGTPVKLSEDSIVVQNLLNASLYPHVQSYTLPASAGELCVCQDGTVVCFGIYVQVFEPREPIKILSQKKTTLKM